jgi:hypothetical protein
MWCVVNLTIQHGYGKRHAWLIYSSNMVIAQVMHGWYKHPSQDYIDGNIALHAKGLKFI